MLGQRVMPVAWQGFTTETPRTSNYEGHEEINTYPQISSIHADFSLRADD